MILTFSKSDFKDKILQYSKIHTIREDKGNRWRVGRKIQFWLGNPRNTRGKTKPYQFAVGEVSRIEEVIMYFGDMQDIVWIGKTCLSTLTDLDDLAKNDGFNSWFEMKDWFCNEDRNTYCGKMIFWKNLVEIVNININANTRQFI